MQRMIAFWAATLDRAGSVPPLKGAAWGSFQSWEELVLLVVHAVWSYAVFARSESVANLWRMTILVPEHQVVGCVHFGSS